MPKNNDASATESLSYRWPEYWSNARWSKIVDFAMANLYFNSRGVHLLELQSHIESHPRAARLTEAELEAKLLRHLRGSPLYIEDAQDIWTLSALYTDEEIAKARTLPKAQRKTTSQG